MAKVYLKQILVLTLFFAVNTAAQNVNAKIEQAMKHYDHLILLTNPDSIAQMYTVDGELGNAARGRDSIKSFLKRFKDFKVNLQESKTVSITIKGDTAVQKGTYHQVTNVPNSGDIEVRGTFNAIWVKVNHDKWLLKRMETKNN